MNSLAPDPQADLGRTVEGKIRDAVRRGALPPRDEALQASWRAACLKDPSMLALLDAAPGSPIFEPSQL